MRNTIRTVLAVVIVAGLFLQVPFSTALGKNIALITKEELKPLLNDTNVVIIDVRGGRDWSSSEFKIKGAVHGDPKKVAEWQKNYPKDKKLVLYCA